MAKKALITGVSGQDGSYLAELLLEKGYHVWGLERSKATPSMANITHLLGKPRFDTVEGDLVEESRLNQIVREIQPDEVYNLAAQSFVPVSWSSPVYTCNVDALGPLRLLEAIRHYAPGAHFYQASSSEMFGRVREVPQTEETYHYPRSPYGAAKSFGYNITRNYRESYGLFACNGALFNHESERRGLSFVTRKITHTAAQIHLGKAEKLVLGNLDARRDWGYAPDYVRAMWMMLQHRGADDYVVATGEDHAVRDFAAAAFKETGVDLEWKGTGVEERGIDARSGKVLVEVSKEFFRPAEVDLLRGDASKARRVLGWKPTVSFHEMVRRMVRHDLEVSK